MGCISVALKNFRVNPVTLNLLNMLPELVLVILEFLTFDES
jgi:hypothetical protein